MLGNSEDKMNRHCGSNKADSGKGNAGSLDSMKDQQSVKNPEEDIIDLDDDENDDISFSVYKSSLGMGNSHPGTILEGRSLSVLRLPEPTYPFKEGFPEKIEKEGLLSDLQLDAVFYACQQHQKLLPFRYAPQSATKKDLDKTNFKITEGKPTSGHEYGNGRGDASMSNSIPVPSYPSHLSTSEIYELKLQAIMKQLSEGMRKPVMPIQPSYPIQPAGPTQYSRAGFFLGDGAGVGKGRQIAGLVLANVARGRVKHVWVSTSADLHDAAVRDLTDIGCHLNVINGCQELDKKTKAFGLSTDFKKGVLFTTYSMLARPSRMQQILDWCGEDYEGLVIFDECHKAKNVSSESPTSGSKVAQAVVQIQRVFPMSRVLYCSATGVTDLKNMAFMERLGIWGPNTQFPNFQIFYNRINAKGLATLEMLGMEMKMAGMYLARSLSFKDCVCDVIEYKITPSQADLYDACVNVWQLTRECVYKYLEKEKSSTLWGNFWSTHQRFFLQLCISLKANFLIKVVKEELKKGHAVVIGLQSTGESHLTKEHRGRPLPDFLSNAKEGLLKFLKNYLPNSQQDEEYYLLRDRLERLCLELPLRGTPLDDIIDALGGPSEVAEMTGRKLRMVRVNSKSVTVQHRADGEDDINNLNNRERARFLAGEKNVAIISEAASTGISLHAARSCHNHRRRVHITIELPWSADRAIQQLGRTHRSDQVSAPIYKLIVCDLPGEKRAASAVSSRLQSLGALTRGDRHDACAIDLASFNLDTKYGRSALSLTIKSIIEGKAIGGDMTVSELIKMRSYLAEMDMIDQNVSDKKITIKSFLNRIMGLPVANQMTLFTYFNKNLDKIIANAKNEGSYDAGIADIRGESIKFLEKSAIYTDPDNKIETVAYKFSVDRGVSLENAIEILKVHQATLEKIVAPAESRTNDHDEDDDGDDMDGFIVNDDDIDGEDDDFVVPDDDEDDNIARQRSRRARRKRTKRKTPTIKHQSGFYISKQMRFGQFYVLLVCYRPNSRVCRTIRPNTGRAPTLSTAADIDKVYRLVTVDEIKHTWERRFTNSLTQCHHGKKCAVLRCSAGKRLSQVSILSGRLISFWSEIERQIMSMGGELSPGEKHMKISRLQTDSGMRIIGLQVAEPLLNVLKDYFNQLSKIDSRRAKSKLLEEEKVDFVSLKNAMTERKTMLSFFTKKPNNADLNDTIVTPKTNKNSANDINHNSSSNSNKNDKDIFTYSRVKPKTTPKFTSKATLKATPKSKNSNLKRGASQSTTLFSFMNKKPK